jgi:hypothetical protein
VETWCFISKRSAMSWIICSSRGGHCIKPRRFLTVHAHGTVGLPVGSLGSVFAIMCRVEGLAAAALVDAQRDELVVKRQ